MHMCHNCVAIATRTAKWFNLTNHLLIHNSNYDTVRMLLDSNKVSARITVFFMYSECSHGIDLFVSF
jgi:hypothetical protein